MKLKSFILSLGTTVLMTQSLLAVNPFQPLSENECPTKSYVVKFSQKTIIESKRVRMAAERMDINLQSLGLLSDIKEIGEMEKEISVIYKPGASLPGVLIPVGFPNDADALIKHQLGVGALFGLKGNKESWRPAPEGFGYMISYVTTGDQNQYTIGRQENKILQSPREFMNGFFRSLKEVSDEGIKQTCLKNHELVKIIDVVLSGNNKKAAKALTPDAVKEVEKLLQSLFSGKFNLNPEAGVFSNLNTTIGKLSLPTRQGRSKKAHRLEIRDSLKNYLTQAGVNLSADKSHLVIAPANK